MTDDRTALAARPRPGLRGLLRRAGAGRAAYHTVHRVTNWVAAGRTRGFVEHNFWRTGAARMKRRLQTLPPVETGRGAAPVTVHYLTGANHWHMTGFAAHSFAVHVGPACAVEIHSDGTLAAGERAALARLFPAARFPDARDTEARLDALLPEARYPALRGHRRVFPLLRKLLDVHAGRTGWNLFLDSDILFFRRPAFLADWTARPTVPVYMTDDINAYFYPEPVLADLAGAKLLDRVNTGVCGLRSEEIDWDRLERWCGTLLASHGPDHFHEQALTAVYLSGRPSAAVPHAECQLVWDRAAGCRTSAPARHYVLNSRPYFFWRAWRDYLATLPPAGRAP